MKIQEHNSKAWDQQVEDGNVWTIPVDEKQIAEARAGRLRILLTPTIPVPADWFPPLQDAKVLCLASGGGQQGPLLAAAGADVTVLDNSQRYEKGIPLEFGHTLDDQIGGQVACGFAITGFYEDRYETNDLLSDYIASFVATKATKLT